MKGIKCRKAAKAERRAHRKSGRSDRTANGMEIHPLGGTMEPALAEQILAAFRGFDPTGPWASVAPKILPVLKRRHHPYPPEAAPLHIRVPPGVWTGFGIDFGPAFSHVSQRLLDGWHIDHATLLGTALENLGALVKVEPPVVDRVPLDGIEVMAVQGQGWGSSLILAPELLQPILGSEPAPAAHAGPQHAPGSARRRRRRPCVRSLGGDRRRRARRARGGPAALDRLGGDDHRRSRAGTPELVGRQGSVELRRVIVEPATPDLMIGAARRDHGPEPRAVPEDAEMGQLVADDGLEGLGGRQDEAPRERQPARSRGTPPAGPRVAQGDAGRSDVERSRVQGDRGLDLAARLVPQPGLEDPGVSSPVRGDAVDDELVVEPDDVRPADPGHRRNDADPVQPTAERDHASVASLHPATRVSRRPAPADRGDAGATPPARRGTRSHGARRRASPTASPEA